MLRNRRNFTAVGIIVLAGFVTWISMPDSSGEERFPWPFHDDVRYMSESRDHALRTMADTVETLSGVIGAGFLGGALRDAGLSGRVHTLACGVLIDSLGWRVQQPGDTLVAVYHRERLAELRAYPRNRRGFFRISWRDDNPHSWEYMPQESWVRRRAVSCRVSSTVWGALWESAIPLDLTPTGQLMNPRDSARAVGYISELQHELTDRIFVYDIDFYYDVRVGDSLWILLEENRYPEDGESGFLRILGARYRFASGRLVEALPFFRFPQGVSESYLDHFHRDGGSLRTMFLKMPVPFGRISSPYSSARLHPVLGYTRAHRGVDYAAPIGTEVYAVGDGVITMRQWHGGYGNFVKIRHASGYETAYAHLNSYASGQSVGTHVRQGQIIGYVGSTGLSTGPHLHFEMLRQGSHVNPAEEIVPPSDPLEGDELQAFLRQLPVLEASWALLNRAPLPLPPPEDGGGV